MFCAVRLTRRGAAEPPLALGGLEVGEVSSSIVAGTAGVPYSCRRSCGMELLRSRSM
jgi:hypothetical protein